MVKDGLLTAGHARVLAGLADSEEQLRLARKAAAEGMSVRQLEQLAARARTTPAKPRTPAARPAEMEELQEKILRKTGLKSSLTGNISRGKIVLQYSSREELEHFNTLLDSLQE